MRATDIIIVPPRLDQASGLRDRPEPVYIQALVPERSVEGFYIRIIGRSSRPGEVQLHVMMVGPQINDPSRKLGAIVGKKCPWGAAQIDQPVQCRTLYLIRYLVIQQCQRQGCADRD